MLTKLKVYLFIVSFLLISAVGNLHAAKIQIPGLYPTGVDNDGNVLSYGEEEIHYILTSYPGDYSSAPTIKVIKPHSSWWWYDDNTEPKAAWIGPSGSDKSDPVGWYSYTLTFNLTGYDPTTVVITGSWASDNESYIYLNGSDTGISNKYDNDNKKSFRELSKFTINSGFNNGINILEFRVYNGSGYGINPTGLLVEDIQGYSVPLPGTIWLLGIGCLFSVIGFKRRNPS